MSVLVVGSIALDDVATPSTQRKNLLGGSASYASVAASFFGDVRLVGIVGTDFPENHRSLFEKHNIDLTGLEVAEGKTFRWSGEYEANMNNRRTITVDLNVFEHFSPKLPQPCRDTPYVLLGNIAPELQIEVLDQMEEPCFVVADTMDLWIEIAQPKLLELLPRLNLLILNDSEAVQLSGEPNLLAAARWLRSRGPEFVAIKKGEHGCYLSSRDREFITPAYPLESVVDPTGAGDTFAGTLAGYLDTIGGGEISFDVLKTAVIESTVMASFTCEDFSLNGLTNLSKEDIQKRKDHLRALTSY